MASQPFPGGGVAFNLVQQLPEGQYVTSLNLSSGLFLPVTIFQRQNEERRDTAEGMQREDRRKTNDRQKEERQKEHRRRILMWQKEE